MARPDAGADRRCASGRRAVALIQDLARVLRQTGPAKGRSTTTGARTMRKLIVSTYLTLDGVIQPLDWSAQSTSPAAREERGRYARELLFAADALLLGRETYEVFAAAWPSRSGSASGWRRVPSGRSVGLTR